MSKPSFTQRALQARIVSLSLLALACAAAGCEDTDEVRVVPGAGSGGGGGTAGSGTAGSGTAGSGTAGSGTAGSAGGGSGGGGSGGDTSIDAGSDASPDASGPADLCVPGALSAYCASWPCPALGGAVASLIEIPEGFISQPGFPIVERSCVAAHGAARVSVAANYGSWTKTFIYDPQTQLLVGVVLTNDVEPICDGTGVYQDELGAFHGERSPDCEWRGTPAACADGDAGVVLDAVDGGVLLCDLSP